MTTNHRVSKDVAATIVASVAPSSNHAALVDTLKTKLGLDTLRFATYRDGYSRSVECCQVMTPNGECLGKLRDWVKTELAANGESPRALWDKHKNGSLLITESDIWHLYLVAPYGDAPEEFLQFEIDFETVWIARQLFAQHWWSPVATVDDLYDVARDGESVERNVVGQPSYAVDEIQNIRGLLEGEAAADQQKKQRLEKTRFVRTDKFGKEVDAIYIMRIAIVTAR